MDQNGVGAFRLTKNSSPGRWIREWVRNAYRSLKEIGGAQSDPCHIFRRCRNRRGTGRHPGHIDAAVREFSRERACGDLYAAAMRLEIMRHHQKVHRSAHCDLSLAFK